MKNHTQILKIVPIEKLPPTAPDFFYYFSTFKVSPNDIVKIPLKNKLTYGIVEEVLDLKQFKIILKSIDYQLKPIKEVTGRGFISEVQKKFAYWLSHNYCLSLSHAYYFFLKFHKKIKNNFVPLFEPSSGFSKIYFPTINLEAIKERPLLLLTPTEEQAKILAEQFYHPDLVLIDLSSSQKEFNVLIEKILKKERRIFVGTKNVVFLPWQKLESILLINEGNINYKELFQVPFFNYLNLIEKLARLLKTKLIVIDEFPSLKTISEKNLEIQQKITFETFESIFEIEKIINHAERVKIFVPTKLTAKKFYCHNCHFEFTCTACHHPLSIQEEKVFCQLCFKTYPLEKNCPQCGNYDLSVKGIGAYWLKKYLEKEGYFVVFINNLKDIKDFLKKKYQRYILLGSLLITHPYLPKTDINFFINFDQAFYVFNPFLKEKYLRILYSLYQTSKSLYLQTRLPQELLQKIKDLSIIKDFLKERSTQKLPPFYKITKLITRLKNLPVLNKRLEEVKEEINKRKIYFEEYIEVSGPFLENLPKIKSRYQMYLLLRYKGDLNLKKLLENIPYIDEIRADEEEI